MRREARHARRRGLFGTRGRSLVTLLIAVLGAIGMVVAAWAYFTSTGSGTGAAATGTLNPPTSVNAGPASGITVPVTWTASATGGGAVAPQGYYVTESNGSTTSPACGTDSTHLITSGTSCTDGNGTSYSAPRRSDEPATGQRLPTPTPSSPSTTPGRPAERVAR